MTPDEHRAEAERLVGQAAECYASGAQLEVVTALSRMADVHARLAQTPQPVTVAADPDAGLADMLAAARVAGSGDGQAILAGRAMAGERTDSICAACWHPRERHSGGIGTCLADDLECPCNQYGYVPAGSEPEPEAGEYGYVSNGPGG